MKKIIYFAIIVTLIISYQCESDSGSNEYPEMEYKTVNIDLIGISKDTLDYSPWLLIFEIDSNETGYNAKIFQNWNDTLGSISDAFHFICIQDQGKIKVFDKDATISDKENWIHPENNSFEDFKGLGEIYMGYKLVVSSNETYNYYGWIRINYSATGDTLKVIDLAKSKESDIAVKAGKK